MQDLNDKVTGGVLTAVEWNEVPSEIQNVIEGLGITLSSGDLNQLGKSIAGYVANGNFYTDSGIADAYVLSVVGAKQRAPQYTNGFQISFLPGNTNTGGSTVNVASLGVITLKTVGGGSVPVGYIQAGEITTAIFDGTDFILSNPLSNEIIPFATLSAAVASKLPRAGNQIKLKERTTSNGGGAFWDTVLTSTVTPNTVNIVISTANALLSFILRQNGTVQVAKIGVIPDDVSAKAANTNAIEVARSQGFVQFLYGRGTYSIEKIELPHTGSYFRRDTGESHEGIKGETFFTRNEVTVPLDYTDQDLFREQCLFRVYGSFHKIANIDFTDCAGAIFMGQDPARAPLQPSPEVSSIAWNQLSNIDIQNCGTGIVIPTTNAGTYFNTFESIHINQCQIGFHTRQGENNTLGAISNFNRNFIRDMRSSRCYIGQLIDDGSTNNMQMLNEGNTSTPTNNLYSFPPANVTPEDISDGDGRGAMFSAIATENTLTLINESCDRFVEDLSGKNLYIGGIPRYLENATSTAGVTVLLDRDGIVQEDFLSATTNIVPGSGLRAGVINKLTEESMHRVGREQNANLVTFGNLAGGASATVVVSADTVNLADTSSMFVCTITADSVASDLAFAKSFNINMRRNAARTPVRFDTYNEVNNRATGVNTSDSTEPMVVSLTVNVKDLELTLTAPVGRDLVDVTMHITELLNGNR